MIGTILAGRRAIDPDRPTACSAGGERQPRQPLGAHVDVMPEAHPFTFMVRRNSCHRNLCDWVIFERQREREISKIGYVYQSEAENAAKARMIELVAAWRTGRR